eukprot:3608261-Pyramimonas_sp.AAC.1
MRSPLDRLPRKHRLTLCVPLVQIGDLVGLWTHVNRAPRPLDRLPCEPGLTNAPPLFQIADLEE